MSGYPLAGLKACFRKPPATTPKPAGSVPPSVTEPTVVNVAEQAPAVADGERPLDEFLLANASARTKFVLPEGRYHLDGRVDLNDVESVAVVGDPHATLVVTDPDQQYGLDLGGGWGATPEESADRVHVRNLTFDLTADGVGAQAVSARAARDLRIEDVTVRGECASAGKKALGAIYAAVTHPDGEGVVNVSLPDGCAFRPDAHPDESPVESQTSHPIGISVTDDHRGRLVFRDCHVEGWVNNGGYLAGGEGPCVVEGGRWKNNGNADLRLGDGDVARDVSVVHDDASEAGYTGCGLWLQEGDVRVEGGELRLPDCDNDGLRVSCAEARVEGLDIDCDSSARVLKINDGDGAVLLEDVHLGDRGDGSKHAYAGEVWRSSTVVRDCRLAFHSESRNGLNLLADGILLDGVTATHDGGDGDGGTTLLVKSDVEIRNSTLRGRVDVDRKRGGALRLQDVDLKNCECVGFDPV